MILGSIRENRSMQKSVFRDRRKVFDVGLSTGIQHLQSKDTENYANIVRSTKKCQTHVSCVRSVLQQYFNYGRSYRMAQILANRVRLDEETMLITVTPTGRALYVDTAPWRRCSSADAEQL